MPVGRWGLLEQLEPDLLEDARRKTPRHWLLVGPRGCGKTHLTELLCRRLRRDPRAAAAVGRRPGLHRGKSEAIVLAGSLPGPGR